MTGPNDLDDPAKRQVAATTTYPVGGIETDPCLGGATVLDDDPTPDLALSGSHADLDLPIYHGPTGFFIRSRHHRGVATFSIPTRKVRSAR